MIGNIITLMVHDIKLNRPESSKLKKRVDALNQVSLTKDSGM